MPGDRQVKQIDPTGNLYVDNYDVKNNKLINYFIAKANITSYRADTGSSTYKEDYVEVDLDQWGRPKARRVYEYWPSLSGELTEQYY